MTTVIDTLVLEFALDPTKFTAGQQQILSDVKKLEEASRKSATETESSTKKLSEMFTGLKREFLGFVGIAVGGIAARRFFDFVTDLDANTSRLSRTLGINVRELSAWQNAAKTVGGTGQEVTGTIMRLEQEVYNFRFGLGSNLPGALRALGGINVFDQAGNPKNGIQLLRDITEAVEKLQMPTAGKAAFLRVLGIDETTINLVIRGRAELEKTIAAMKEAGGTTEESGRAAEEYQKNLAQLETTAINVGRAFTGPLIRGLNAAIEKFKEWRNVASPSGGAAGAGGGIEVPGVGWVPGMPPEGGAPSTGANTAPLGNWMNFLAGLSYLETTQKGGGNTGSTAQGFFQFLKGTADKARAAGISDPRFGSYSDQAGATQRYIQKFYPQAAAAIERGDFKAAQDALKGEWPSLPGGSQPQSAARYATYAEELRGGGPRPGATITVQNMTVNSAAPDAAGIATDIKKELTHTSFTAQVPQGQQ